MVTTFQVLKGESDQADEMHDQNMCAKKKNNNVEKKKKKKFKEGLWINGSLFPDLKAEYSDFPSSAKVMAQFP